MEAHEATWYCVIRDEYDLLTDLHVLHIIFMHTILQSALTGMPKDVSTSPSHLMQICLLLICSNRDNIK